MLGGVAPILIFTFPPSGSFDVFKKLSGIPGVKSLIPTTGIPIPLYLDENLTGIYVESETKALDVDTDIVANYDATNKTTTYSNQSGINNLITINMLASRESIFLTALIAFMDMIFNELVTGKYKVSYLNKGTTVFNGLLHSFSTSADANDTLNKIVLQIIKPNLTKPTPTNQYFPIAGQIARQPTVVAGA